VPRFSHAPICCNEVRFEVILPEYRLTTGEFLTLTPSLGVIHCEYRHKCYITKTIEALGYISTEESLGISSTTFTQCAMKATEVAEITQKMAITPFKVIQGHRF